MSTVIKCVLVWLIGLNVSIAWAQIAPCESNDVFQVYCVKPSQTNPEIKTFDKPHYVLLRRDDIKRDLPLMVFMPGTTGQPPGPVAFLRTAASHGYRVISLEYNDEPSIAVFCPEHGGPECSGRMRHMRVYGNVQLNPEIDNTHPEAIVERLFALLKYLDRQHPDQNWSRYFNDHGMVWERIALSGQSQGAGMAAFIGKQKVVNRIILFSSPWDFYRQRDRHVELAPWLAWEAKTPLSRWFAGYNVHEKTTELLARAYRMLNIPPEHIRIFSLPLPSEYQGKSDNPYHLQGIHNIAYRPDWIFFLTAPTRDTY